MIKDGTEGNYTEGLSQRFMYYCGLLLGQRNNPNVKVKPDDLKHIRDLIEAEKQGLLLKLPVSIGCDVYFIPSKVNYKLNKLNHHEENNRVYHQNVARIVFTERGWYVECDKDIEYATDRILVDKLYKETWFISQEEAEEALKKAGGINEKV